MIIEMTVMRIDKSGMHPVGQVRDLPENEARELIDAGQAKVVAISRFIKQEEPAMKIKRSKRGK